MRNDRFENFNRQWDIPTETEAKIKIGNAISFALTLAAEHFGTNLAACRT